MQLKNFIPLFIVFFVTTFVVSKKVFSLEVSTWLNTPKIYFEKDAELNLEPVHREMLRSRILGLVLKFRERLSTMHPPDFPAKLIVVLENSISPPSFFLLPARYKEIEKEYPPPTDAPFYYLWIDPSFVESIDGLRLLAHESFHAFHYSINPKEEDWVKEGLAQLFDYLISEKLNFANLKALQRNPNAPLIAPYDSLKQDRAQYAQSFLFFLYLYNRCGGEELLWQLARGKDQDGNLLSGMENIHYQIKRHQDEPNCPQKDLLASFALAKAHNQFIFTSNAGERERYAIDPSLGPFASVPQATSLGQLNLGNALEISSNDLPRVSAPPRGARAALSL